MLNKLLATIPLKRLFLYLVLLSFLPPAFMLFSFMKQLSHAKEVNEQIINLKEEVLLQEKKQAVNKAVIDHFAHADKFYIDKQLESIQLLLPEINLLEKNSRQNQLIDNEQLLEQLNALKNKNKIVFAEGSVQTYPGFTETQESLVQPIQLNAKDLQLLLSRIEGVVLDKETLPEGSPQLIITDFRLEKTKNTDNNELFQMHLKLLKREYN